MESKILGIHDLLRNCAEGEQDPEVVSQEVITFCSSDLAPNPAILSDVLLDTLFLHDTAVSHVDEALQSERRGRLGVLVSNLVVSILSV